MYRMERPDERIIETLLRCPLFMGLKEPALLKALKQVSYRMKTYPRDAFIAREGERVFFQHIVISGSVRGEMVDLMGRVIKIEDILPPRPLAPAFLFGKQNNYPVNIITNETTEIFSVPADAFLDMMQNSRTILRNYVEIVSSRGQFLSSKIRFLSFTTIKGKLARYLLDLSEASGSVKFRIPLSQARLSELFAVARPSVGRALSEMNLEGIVRTEGKEVEILDRGRLLSYLKQDGSTDPG